MQNDARRASERARSCRHCDWFCFLTTLSDCLLSNSFAIKMTCHFTSLQIWTCLLPVHCRDNFKRQFKVVIFIFILYNRCYCHYSSYKFNLGVYQFAPYEFYRVAREHWAMVPWGLPTVKLPSFNQLALHNMHQITFGWPSLTLQFVFHCTFKLFTSFSFAAHHIPCSHWWIVVKSRSVHHHSFK